VVNTAVTTILQRHFLEQTCRQHKIRLHKLDYR